MARTPGAGATISDGMPWDFFSSNRRGKSPIPFDPAVFAMPEEP